jgi:hypothetical protein
VKSRFITSFVFLYMKKSISTISFYE